MTSTGVSAHPTGPLSVELTIRRGDVLIEATLTAEPGRPLGLVGPNGAGKSSILGAIAGLVPADGSVRAGGRELGDLTPERRRIGLVFQDLLLFRHLSVRDNVAFGRRVRSGRRAGRRETAMWLDRLGLAELAERLPYELSGGQAQRVALARALAAEPDALLLDEPMAALDVELRDELRRDLGGRLRDLDIPVIVVTHSLRDIEALADEVVVLEAGRMSQRGTLDELRRAPATAYVERLVRGGIE
jgi:molybdate transport system ATP-binding protein